MTSKLRNFEIQNRLGSGSYGVIFKAINKTQKSACVLKQIRMNKMSEKAKKTTLMEATIMGKLIHPFIVQYKDSFVEDTTLHIIMQYCDNGDLSMFLKLQNKKPLKQQKIWKFFIQICMGVEYIHKNKILHRDIKTLNIFLNKNQDIKIGDLGVAKMLMSNDFAQTVVGTPFYLSPELCQQKPYNQKSDIWALGCLLYELCTYKHPFEAANQASLILKIIRGKYLPIPQFYSKQLKEMIDLCLQRDYKRRPTASSILSRTKIKQYIKQFNLEQKINQQYLKMKANKQNKQPQFKQIPKQIINKQVEKKSFQPLVEQKISKKQEQPKNNPLQQPSSKNQPYKINNLQHIHVKDDRKFTPQEHRPNGLEVVNKSLEKPRIQSQIFSNDKGKDSNVKESHQTPRPVKQTKQQFLHNLRYVVDDSKKSRQSSDELNSAIVSQKSRLQKIDNKIQDQLRRQKQLQKKKSQIGIKLPQGLQKVEQNKLSDKKEVNHMPPMPPKPKEQVIRVKMDSACVPKVPDTEVKKPGVIKTRGFNQQMSEIKIQQRKIDFKPRKSVENIVKPVLFGLQEDSPKQMNSWKSSQKNFQSEKHIKITDVRAKQTPVDRYVFKKKPGQSRVRGSQQQISRQGKHASKYSEVTKEQEDLVMNLPDLAGEDSDDEKWETKESKAKTIEVSNDIVLQKYEEIISAKSIDSLSNPKSGNGSNKGETVNNNLSEDEQLPSEKVIRSPSIHVLSQQHENQQILDQPQQHIDIPQMDIQAQTADAYANNLNVQEWSFDQQPELPLLQDKQSIYFEQINPYLLPEQEQSLEQKRQYLQIKLQQNMKRQDQINKLMQIKIEECKAIAPKHFHDILDFFRTKINMDDEYTQNDEKEVEDFLRKKGLTDQRKFQNIYKILHFEMELENTRKIIQRICKKLSELEDY